MSARTVALGAVRFVAAVACAAGLLHAVLHFTVHLTFPPSNWGLWTQIEEAGEVARFCRAYADASEGEAWTASVAAIDADRLSRSVGPSILPPLYLESPRRYRLVVDDDARVGALFEPRAPSARLVADGWTADVFGAEFVHELAAADDLGWTLDDPRVEWRAIDRGRGR